MRIILEYFIMLVIGAALAFAVAVPITEKITATFEQVVMILK